MLTPKDIAKMIDHSLLRPELDVETVKKGLAVAKKYGTATVCVRPCDLGLAREALAGTALHGHRLPPWVERDGRQGV